MRHRAVPQLGVPQQGPPAELLRAGQNQGKADLRHPDTALDRVATTLFGANRKIARINIRKLPYHVLERHMGKPEGFRLVPSCIPLVQFPAFTL